MLSMDSSFLLQYTVCAVIPMDSPNFYEDFRQTYVYLSGTCVSSGYCFEIPT